jgi:hypothetical protein
MELVAVLAMTIFIARRGGVGGTKKRKVCHGEKCQTSSRFRASLSGWLWRGVTRYCGSIADRNLGLARIRYVDPEHYWSKQQGSSRNIFRQ